MSDDERPKLTVVQEASAPPQQKRSSPMKGRKATPAQKAALEAGQKKRKGTVERARAARARGDKTPLQRYLDGEYPVREWDMDELERGYPKTLGGSFNGQPPRMPGRTHGEIRREVLRRGDQQLNGMYLVSLKVLQEIAEHGENEAARVKAANLLIERTAGKAVERIEIKSSDPWQDILDEVLDDDVLVPDAAPGGSA